MTTFQTNNSCFKTIKETTRLSDLHKRVFSSLTAWCLVLVNLLAGYENPLELRHFLIDVGNVYGRLDLYLLVGCM